MLGGQGKITETLRGIVSRVTYHNPENGFSVLAVSPFGGHGGTEKVLVHQTRVFPGATMEFTGRWTVHRQYGRQFVAERAVEKKPADCAALEKYLGSGLIKGVGPKTARKIVRHFGERTLEVFEGDIDRLLEVPGIAHKKLEVIRAAWREHRAVRDVMMFLQGHGVSTLFAVRIYKTYGDRAIAMVTEDPYRLAADIYGIGFFSADKIALAVGLSPDSPQRLRAAVRHVLSAGREFGHCYLTLEQVERRVEELLGLSVAARLPALLDEMEAERHLMTRRLPAGGGETVCYYAKSLYFDERYVAEKIRSLAGRVPLDADRVERWLERYCRKRGLRLSPEQAGAVKEIAAQRFSILTGGPGCGKTTATKALADLLAAMGKRVVLAAPTGRAAQRMADVIGMEAKTIHRLLEWRGGEFKRNEQAPLKADFLIVDECSMLDITLAASLLRAVPMDGQVLFIGDPDQLPSVGAGNVLRDLIASGRVPCLTLTKVFRQARQSLIISCAHQINRGEMPRVASPFDRPELWRQDVDCLFLDADEATREQLSFIARAKRALEDAGAPAGDEGEDPFSFGTGEKMLPYEPGFTVPEKFRHVDLAKLLAARSASEELMAVLKKVHPWSALRYGLGAADVVRKLYLEWIPRYRRPGEIQILCPMTRGSLGTAALNAMIQEAGNPAAPGKGQITVGERVFRVGDRVIHRRNNYDLNVFNGDIGMIAAIDAVELTCVVRFSPDGREVVYRRDDITELDLAYAVTIHKAQGSEFEAVIIPLLSQHYRMLYRNLIYTGVTRARKLAVLVGTRKALFMAVKNEDTAARQTALRELMREAAR